MKIELQILIGAICHFMLFVVIPPGRATSRFWIWFVGRTKIGHWMLASSGDWTWRKEAREHARAK